VKPNCRRPTDSTSFFLLRKSWDREVTPTILRHMLTLAIEFMPALATSRIMSASESCGVGAGPLPMSSISYRRARHHRRRLQEQR
jgi:hypothetical protein